MRVLVLIPSYNTGPDLLRRTVGEVLRQGEAVRVVIDGSTDGSAEALAEMMGDQLKVSVLPVNQGKGQAIRRGVAEALAEGFTHILTCDADGQHPVDQIGKFVALAATYPTAVLMGCPVFGPEAPSVRVRGRMISNGWSWLETMGWGVGDSLFGMRLYPAQSLHQALASTRFARRFDYDTEIAVRLAWMGVPMIQVPAPVKYLTTAEGGVSQFRYLRDNALLTWMHTRLFLEFMIRSPWLLWRQLTGRGNPHRHVTDPVL
jgi:glycosyltransferase involved in cell wall biosynthesis